jgi:Transglycosylase-like domain
LSAVVRTGLSRYAYQGRHRTPETTATAVRSAALGAGVVTAVLAGTAAPASAAGDPWAQLRQCESGGNYSTNTGNGYYGAYQFDIGTWRAYGGSGLPSAAPPSEQDYRAKLLYRARGWAPWPACSSKLGLRHDPAYGVVGTKRAAAPAPKHKITISAPARVGAQSVYRVTGTSRADSAVTVKIRAGGHAPWRAYPKRTDGNGRYSLAWRARTDYQFQVVGERTSPIRTVRIGTTATAAPTQQLAAGTPTVTVAGTGRPRAKLIVFVTTSTGKWRTWAKLSTDASGRWKADLPAPATSLRFYAKSANGQRSPVRSVST